MNFVKVEIKYLRSSCNTAGVVMFKKIHNQLLNFILSVDPKAWHIQSPKYHRIMCSIETIEKLLENKEILGITSVEEQSV